MNIMRQYIVDRIKDLEEANKELCLRANSAELESKAFDLFCKYLDPEIVTNGEDLILKTLVGGVKISSKDAIDIKIAMEKCNWRRLFER